MTSVRQRATLTIPLCASLALACPAVAMQSDDFNTCGVDAGRWAVLDPLGQSTVSVTGMGSGEARAVIAIPAGASHDVWTTYNDTVRIMQPAADGDFEIQVKFSSLLNAGYQMQGILIEQDAGRFLRYDFVHDGSSTFLFSATFSAGSATVRGTRSIANGAPLWLSIRRQASQWTLRYSYDGAAWSSFTSFSFVLGVTRVGPFAGNWSNTIAPAVTVEIDYFLNVAAPFVQEDAPSSSSQLTLTTSTTGSGTIVVSPARPAYTCGEAVRLEAVPANGWLFENWTGDLAGTEPVKTISMLASRNVGATFVARPPPPLLVTHVVVDATDTAAVITWNTSNPADGVVRYGPTTGYESGQAGHDELVSTHSVTIAGLAPNTLYHYSITCTDQSGQTTATPDATFTTRKTPRPFVSDDFNAPAIDTGIWTIMNPTGQAAFRSVGTNTPDARVEIALPAGAHHEAWVDGIFTPWLKQDIPDTDFGIEARFDSPIDRRWQAQGLIVQQDHDSYIRADFYADNATPYVFVASLDNGAVRTFANRTVPAGAPYWLRLVRVGNQFTVSYSKNARAWTTAATFTHAMKVTGAGPFVANEGTPAPAFTGLVDYCFSTANPILREDGQPEPDYTPPAISGVQVSARNNAIDVGWSTDEPADSRVYVGKTTGYELGAQYSSNLTTDHRISIAGLQPSTTYNLKIVSTDASSNQGQSGNLVATTTGSSSSGLTIDVWYGDSQTFGHIGAPVPMINILGQAYGPSGIASLTYTLNGGAARTLRMGPNSMRLAETGDFNVEIPFGNLQPGVNSVQIRARDSLGREAIRTVGVDNRSGPVWPLPYTLTWSGAASINDIAQVLDGLWFIQGNSVRTAVMAYDRLIAVGDVRWSEYEASCPVTVHAIDPNGYPPPSYGPGVGLLVRWPGHSNDGSQPWQGIYPLGAIGMFRWTNSYERFQIFGNNGRILASTGNDSLQLGVTYIFKMRVENVPGAARYSYKWWRAGQSEPSGWQLVGTQSDDPGFGSLVLLAHHVDASFGEVTIRSIR